MTVGWFLRDRKLAMLQTPHHFYSPDPFERNLGQFRVIPNEGELFYGVVQDGNDFWNATFFCGSCAVLRRSGARRGGRHRGRDRHRRRAHLAAHADERLEHGLHQYSAGGRAGHGAALSACGPAHSLGARHDSDSAHRQSALCARPDLSAAALLLQRDGHFLYAVPRLIFLTAPLIYLLLNHTNIPGYWAAILAYALPHLTLSNVTNSRIQGEHRHSFWNEIYETVLVALHSAAHHDGAHQSQAGQVQRDGQGRRGQAHVLRFEDRAAVSGDAGVQHRRTARRHSAFLHLGSRSPGHGDDERDLVLLQRRHSGCVHGRCARAQAVAHNGAHQRGNARRGENAGRKIVGRGDNRHVQRRHQHPV